MITATQPSPYRISPRIPALMITTPTTVENVQTNMLSVKGMFMSVKIVSGQTGKFSKNSSSGNKYIILMYAYGGNTILIDLLKSRLEDK